jgi:hypothetical protein
MKTKIHFVTLLLFASFFLNAQTPRTITLQPDSCKGKDALIGDCGPCGYPNLNLGDHQDMLAASWTISGNTSNVRALIDFDLSGIPTGSTIVSAKLSLYHNPNSASGNTGHSQIDGSNEAWLRRITSTWGEYSVTWNTQPTTTTQNQLVIPASTSNTQNYIDINVATLVQDMVNNPQQSFGFELQLQTESPKRSLLFASSDHPNAALHPKLEITYLLAPTSACVSFQPGNTICDDGKDALIGDCIPCGYPDLNLGDHQDMLAASWTLSGNTSNVRALLGFDLSSIPANTTITSATLSLYHNPNSASGNTGHSQIDGSNEAWLQRITSSWNESTVTWNTQPTTSTRNQVIVPASTSNSQNYLNIDVAALVQDMIDDPQTSFGFMLRLQTESPKRSLLFASSDHPNAALHPKLDICYSFSVGINALGTEQQLVVYPNPTNGAFNITMPEILEDGNLTIYNIAGEKIYTDTVSGKYKTVRTELSKGMYFVHVSTANKTWTTKIVSE